MKLVRGGGPVTSMPEFEVGPPIDEGAPGLCLDAFPSVFNEGIADEQDGRHVSVKSQDYWETMFKQDDWAAATHHRLPYWVWDRENRRRLRSCRIVYTKHTPGVKQWTAEKIREVGINKVVKRMVGYLQDVPGSPGDMGKLRWHLTSVIDQMYADTGRLPLLFSTATAANSHWRHLHRLLPTGRASDSETLDLLTSEDEDQCLGEHDLVVKRRNWVNDTVSWKPMAIQMGMHGSCLGCKNAEPPCAAFRWWWHGLGNFDSN